MLEEGPQELELAALSSIVSPPTLAHRVRRSSVISPTSQLRSSAGVVAAAAQLDADPGDQLLEVERLRQVVVGAGLEARRPARSGRRAR